MKIKVCFVQTLLPVYSLGTLHLYIPIVYIQSISKDKVLRHGIDFPHTSHCCHQISVINVVVKNQRQDMNERVIIILSTITETLSVY